MGKRSSFERIERDCYDTPFEAAVPLLKVLPKRVTFVEPCAGSGRLIRWLCDAGHVCTRAWDIEPRGPNIAKLDALKRFIGDADCFITNPPWDRQTLHPMIRHFSSQLPTWLLFDADWMHTRQAAPYLPLLRQIVSVGRVKWIPDSPFTGKDNCAWYLFDAHSASPAIFIGREAA